MTFLLVLALGFWPQRHRGAEEILESELQRAQTALARLDPAPYFIGYSATDVETVQISASNGALESVSSNQSRWLDVSVRVGGYELDSTHRVPGETGQASFQLPRRAPLDGEADSWALRRALWRATDRAYKDAVRQYLRILAAKDVRVAAEDSSADFARLPARPAPVAAAPATLGPDVDRRIEHWKAMLRRYSESMRRQRHILNSRIQLAVRASTRSVVTSDGIRSVEPALLFRLGLLAEAKAADGMDLNRYESFEARDENGLPAPEVVEATIVAMAADLKALQAAPVLEPFSGPAILSGRAAAVFFHEALGHRVEGHRQRGQEEGQTFAHKVGERILPEFLSVYDDPTRRHVEVGGRRREVMGAYAHDDEGVPAQRVPVVENGVLRNFLLSRTPVRGFAASNGHGRAEPGQTPVGRQGNLLVSSSRTVPRDRLRRMLLDEIKRRGKPYGLLFGDVEGGYTLTHRYSAQVFQVFPLMVWKVFPDGRPDELVRGAELVGTPLVTLGKILAAGDDPQLFNGYCGAESGYIPVSALAPSLLIAEMEVQKKAKSSDRPPLLAPPDASPGGENTEDLALAAMRHELRRNMDQLRLANLEKPYYMEYRMADVQRAEVAASNGALTERGFHAFRPLTASVRVGDRSLDNTNFVSSVDPGASGGGAEQFTIALDPSYAALRQDLWIASDVAYKRALSSLAAKRAFLRTSDQDERLPDFSRAAPVSALRPRVERIAETMDDCAAMVRRLSSLMASPALDSTVRLTAHAANQYFVNSEGTALRAPQQMATLRASVTAETPDGARLRAGFSAPAGCSAAEEKRFAARAESARRELESALAAPPARGEEYVGPALAEPEAAAAIFTALLPGVVAGRRAPLSDNPFVAESAERDAPALNSRVLPAPFEVTDAGIEVDDEGVPGAPLRLIERGLLKRFLASRTPVKGALESNGRGRATPGGAASAAPVALTVRAEGAVSAAELKMRLMALCRERGLAYGLLIRRFQMAGTADELTTEDLSEPSDALIAGALRGGSPLQPLSVWRVYADGREEQVRGLRLADLRLGALKGIVAAGSETHTEAGFFTPPTPFSTAVMAVGGATEGVPFTLSAPAVLFDELVFRPQRRSGSRGPALEAPRRAGN